MGRKGSQSRKKRDRPRACVAIPQILVQDTGLPPLPALDADGHYPAMEHAKISLARKIIRDRKRLGLSQVELARRAGIAPESLNRLEHGKANATIQTIEKIDVALRAAEKRPVRTRTAIRSER